MWCIVNVVSGGVIAEYDSHSDAHRAAIRMNVGDMVMVVWRDLED